MSSPSPNRPTPDRSALETLLRRDRALVACGLAAVVALAWLHLLRGAGTEMREMEDMVMPMAGEPWSAGHAAIMLVMWAAMMMAMMLPSAAPMILLYASIVRRRAHRGALGVTAVFALGYVAVWAAFGIAATMMQWSLDVAALLSPTMRTTSVAIAGAVLIGAGLYQWTPLKQACLRHCRSPLDFVLTRWREGTRGAFGMGLRHGTYCLGCCWLLMALLFVGGVMNLAWIVGIAAFVLVEKTAPAGHWLGRIAGGGLVAWGAATLLALA
jgi:predicted metal-binding membrane protein